MNVLGLFGFGMNPGACLLRDGRLMAMAEEERFTRVKGAPGEFPGRAAAWCLRSAALALGDVDRIAFAWDASKYPYRMLLALVRQYLKYRGRAGRGGNGRGADATMLTVVSNLLKYTPARLREDIRLGLRAQGLEGDVPRIEFVPHHLCHAYSCYFTSPFREALVLTLDGSGEEVCTQVALGRGESLTVAESIRVPHSLGWYYAAFTAYFGFTPYQHEGKLMGLAGLGHSRARENPWPERLSRVLRVEDGGYEVDPAFTRLGGHTHAERFTDALVGYLTGFDPTLSPLLAGAGASGNGRAGRCVEPNYVDLAWGVQSRLEEAALSIASRAAERHGLSNLCVAGGVGLNCKMNGVLRSEGPFERVFVQPACHDAGTALGAAMVVAQQSGDPVRNEMAHAAWGPEWSSGEIRTLLERCQLSFEVCPDIGQRVAGELAAGKLVGWFQGRMEIGPRALGSRSMLANPLEPGITDRLNREIKGREPWRPFCPSILEDEMEGLLEEAAPAPFMTTAFDLRPAERERLSSVVHVDGSVRPQTVSRAALPRYHDMIAAFRERTGLPLVLNTSFNVAGEPIVCTPSDALRCFFSTGLDVLALGDFVLNKR